MNPLAAPQVTITYEPVTPSPARPEQAHLGLVAAPGSRTRDLATLLRQRLMFFNLVLALVFALGFLGYDLPGIIQVPDRFRAMDWIFATQHLLVVLVSAHLCLLLRGGRSLTLLQLRWIELPTVVPTLVFIVTNDVNGLLAMPLAETWRKIGSTQSTAQSAYWLVLIILYGTLIPNTWRRCALVTTTFGLTPLVLSVVMEAWLGFPTPPRILVAFLTVMAAVLGCTIPAIVFNIHRLDFLRNQVLEARQLGQYRLGRRLGAGGMGEVFLAEHVLLRRPCALKLIRAERAGDIGTLQRFEREVQVTATLTHPNTIQVFDYGRADDGTFYYVMEYLPGLTLEELIKAYGLLPPARAIHLLRQICGTLREAHAVGLIHRDIKPGNVIVCERGGVGDVAKVLDFGLVRTTASQADEVNLTQEGAVTGTPAYMSPEQAAAKGDLDARSDIYSVGALAYFLLAGRAPFAGRSSALVIAAHLYEAPAPLAPHRSDVPADLEAVVLRCLAKDPAERFPDAESLEAALAECRCAGQWTGKDAVLWWRSIGLRDEGGQATELTRSSP